jgi:hypothetical protein
MAILLCTGPYLTGSCATDGACFEACEAASCGQCPAGSAASSCQTTVETTNCATWYSPLSCATQGLPASGEFCDPSAYATFGAWLQAVGGHYCAN